MFKFLACKFIIRFANCPPTPPKFPFKLSVVFDVWKCPFTFTAFSGGKNDNFWVIFSLSLINVSLLTWNSSSFHEKVRDESGESGNNCSLFQGRKEKNRLPPPPSDQALFWLQNIFRRATDHPSERSFIVDQKKWEIWWRRLCKNYHRVYMVKVNLITSAKYLTIKEIFCINAKLLVFLGNAKKYFWCKTGFCFYKNSLNLSCRLFWHRKKILKLWFF